jgi:hypothetical protein
MKIYECNPCDYKTDQKKKYQRHTETIKHKEHINNMNIYMQRDKYELRDSKILELKEIIEDLKEERYIEIQKKYTSLETKYTSLEKENSFKADTIINMTDITKSSMNSLSFLITNYKECPAIQSFNKFELLMAEGAKSIAESVIFYYKKDKLDSYIGDIIIIEYKTENAQIRAIWNTDTSRLGYIIRELINNKAEWSVDKGGIKTGDYIIEPIMNYLKKDVRAYIRETKKIMEQDDVDDRGLLLKNMEYGAKMVREIINGNIKKSIVKYIAPNFYLDKKKEINIIKNKK